MTMTQLMLLVSAMLGADTPGATVIAAHEGCRVVAAERLPRGLTEESICKAVKRAMADRAPRAHYGVDIQILSKSRLAATLTVNRQTLPTEYAAVSDGVLGSGSIHRLADRLAALAATR
jgi:hypothetical protein